MNLSWTAVPGAAKYRVLRTETSQGYTLVASVPAPLTSFTDFPVRDGVEYWYRIQAVGQSPVCVSAVSNDEKLIPWNCKGSILLDRQQLGCDETFAIRLMDGNATTPPDPEVTAWSGTEPAAETITLTPNPQRAGEWTGTLQTTTDPPVNKDGKVSVVHGDTVALRYEDADFCGSPYSVDKALSVDCQGPVISNIIISPLLHNKAVILWDTDKLADSSITYQCGSSGSITLTDPTMVLKHSIALTGLTPCTVCTYKIFSTDFARHTGYEPPSGTLSFTTTGLVTLFSDAMESGINGWWAEGLWHQASEPVCTPAAHSGTHSWYYGIDSGATPQCTYDTGWITAGRLVSPLIPALPPHAVLSFWDRSVTDYRCRGLGQDRTRLDISTDGGTTWISRDICRPSGDPGTWAQAAKIDLDEYAGKDIRLAFRFDSATELYNAYFGWMVDDVVVQVPSADACGPHARYGSLALSSDICSISGAGDNDGTWDPDELVQFHINLTNDGNQGLTGVSALLEALTPGVLVQLPDASTFPDIASQETAPSKDPYSVLLPPALLCGNQVLFRLAVTSDQGTWIGDFRQQIGRYLSIPIYAQDFSPLDPWPPPGWTIVDGGLDGYTWFRDSLSADHPSPSPPCSSLDPAAPLEGGWAAVDSACASPQIMDEQLLSPVMDLTGMGTVILEFDHFFLYKTDGLARFEAAEVDVSSDGGATWTNVGHWGWDTGNPLS